MSLLLDELHILFSVLGYSFWLLRDWTHLIKRYLCLYFRLLILDIRSFIFNQILRIFNFHSSALLFLFSLLLFIWLNWLCSIKIWLWRLIDKVYLMYWILFKHINTWLFSSHRGHWCIFNLRWFHFCDLVVNLFQDNFRPVIFLWIHLMTQHFRCILFILLLHQDLLWVRSSFFLWLRIELHLFLHLWLIGEILWIWRYFHLTWWYVFFQYKLLFRAWTLPFRPWDHF